MIKINDLDITAFVADASIKPIGDTLKTSSASIPGTNRYSQYHAGIEPRGWTLSMWGVDNEIGLDAVMAAFNNAPEGSKFYPYKSDRFARIWKSKAWEAQSYHYGQDAWAAEAEIYATISDLFAEASTVWNPSADEFHGITPVGTIDAPLDEIEIVGLYGTQHIASPVLEIWNAAKTLLEDSVLITNMLLTDEELILDYRGNITQVYNAPMLSGVNFVQDAINVGCSIGSDGLAIEQDCSATYHLSGPWPLTSNIVITGVVTGSGYLLYSYDNSVWKTATSKTDLSSSTSWTIPNTAGHSDVYVKFATSSGGIDVVERSEDTILAEVLAPSRSRNSYYKGLWGKTISAGEYAYVLKIATNLYAWQLQAHGAVDLTNVWSIGTSAQVAQNLYDNSVAVTVPDRTTSQILAEITTPSPTRDVTKYYRGIWGRTAGSSTYAYVEKLDSGNYAYQIQQGGAVVPGNAIMVGTDAQTAQAIYDASIIVGDRSQATILANIIGSNPDRNQYYRGIWGQTNLSGYYMFVIQLNAWPTEMMYAYQLQLSGAEVDTNPWGIGTADQVANALYTASTPIVGRTASQMQTDINSGVAGVTASSFYRGVWGRTMYAGYYMLMFKLDTDLYAFQLQNGNINTGNPFYIGTREQASQTLYNASQSGSRNADNIATDITNTFFPNPILEEFTVYGAIEGGNPYCNIIVVQNSPLVLAFQGHDSTGYSPTWYLDVRSGATIVNALVADSTTPGAGGRTLANIKSDVITGGPLGAYPNMSTWSWSVQGPFAGQKPSAVVIQLCRTPRVFAYTIMPTAGTWSNWAIDAQAGQITLAALEAATVSTRTVADIKADVISGDGLGAYPDPATYSYQVYGYVAGARPVATIIQANNSPQKLVYKISLVDGTDTAWLVETNGGLDCRDALIAGFSGVSGGRSVSDIQNDIDNPSGVGIYPNTPWPDSTTYDWQVWGMVPGSKPVANIIQVQDSGPRVLAYQIDSLESGPGSWTIDGSLGSNIASTLYALSGSVTPLSGTMYLRNMVITQKRRIPWQELPVIPVDGREHQVLIRAPAIQGSSIFTDCFLKAVADDVGDDETFQVVQTASGKVNLQTSTGRYLSSGWTDDYIIGIRGIPGTSEEFDIIPLGNSCAIRSTSGQYLSIKNSGLGYVFAASDRVGESEIFALTNLGDGKFAFKVTAPVESDPMILDQGSLDFSVLDGNIDEASPLAGKYLSAVSGTLSGINVFTITYRDRYYI